MIIIAHRGASGSAPENTLNAVRQALRQGADAVEVDLRQTKDGVVVLMHDPSVDRTTNGAGIVGNITYSDIAPLDAGSWYGAEFAGQRVPTLDDLLSEVQGRTMLLLEVKAGTATYPGIERRIIDSVRLFGASVHCVVQAFDQDVLDAFHELAPEIELHKLAVAKLPLVPLWYDTRILWGTFPRRQWIRSVNVHRWSVTPALVGHMHAKNVQVMPWVVDDPGEIRRLVAMGVDGLITNHPGRSKGSLSSVGGAQGRSG